jgi:hypothetical protein
MKKTLILIILIFLIQPLFSYDTIHMKVSSLYVKKTGTGTYRVETSIEQRGLIKELFEDTGVIIPVEDKVISGNFADKLNERNFLFAGIDLDLNNDGDSDDTFTIYKKSGRLFIEKQEIQQLILPKLYKRLQGISYYDRRKQPRLTKIGENGNTFIVYNANLKKRKITIGIGTKKKPVEFQEFPNPCLQIVVFKTIDNLSQKPSYRITGLKNHILFTNEKIFENQADEWISAVWGVKRIEIKNPLKKKYIFTLTGITPPFAVMMLGNLSLEKGFRIRTLPVIRVVK